MKLKYAEKMMKQNTETYNRIAQYFSQTRFYISDDIKNPLRYVLDQAFPREGITGRVLDLGCGSGRMWDFFKHYPVQYVGVDASAELIKSACSHYDIPTDTMICEEGRVQFQVKTIEQLSYPDNSFDLVTLIAVLNHIPHPRLQQDIINEAYRVLRPGGYIFLTNWNMWRFDSKKTIWPFWQDRLNLDDSSWEDTYYIPRAQLGTKDVITVWQSQEAKGPLFYYAYTLGQLKRQVKKAGFHVLESHYADRHGKKHWWNGKNLVVLAKK